MRSSIWLVLLAAVLSPVAAPADPGPSTYLPQGSVFALPVAGVVMPLLAPGAPPTVSLATPVVAGVRYRPREYRERGRVMPTTTQLHVGFFDPTDNFSSGFNGGFRIGPQADPNVQIGLALDWWHKSESHTVSIEQGPLPGGGTGERRLELSRSSADLVPILGFVQVSGSENMSVIPYAGIGAGFEVLSLSADDFETGESFEATYAGFGWQVWAGAAVPLSGRTRVTGEVFYNGCEVGRDVDDAYYAATYRELVKMDGVGLRIGLSWGF